MPLSANEYRFGLGKREASLLAVLAEGHKAVFSVEDAKSIAGSDAGEVVRRLVRKKWVLALKRGLYAVVPLDVGVRAADAFVVHNFVIASLLVKPYYIGYWSALNHHGLTEQIPRTTFLATTKAKHSIEILNAEYRFVTLTARKFFGWEEVQVEGRPITLSDPEKTIADCLDHPEHCGGVEQVARALYFAHQETQVAKVVAYARRMGNGAILKRLGFILEATGLLPRYEQALARFVPSLGFPSLDPLSPKRGRHNMRWRLLVNYELDPEGWRY